MAFRKFTSSVTADTTITTTTETVVATVSGITLPRGGIRVSLAGWAQVTTGGSTTALTARIRRGTDATGTLIGEANAQQLQAAAGQTEPIDIAVDDTPGELASGTYVLTVQQTAAAANGSCLQAELTAEILD